jgi:hypothetical protein
MTPSPTPDRRDVLNTATRLAAASSLAGLAGSTAAAGDPSHAPRSGPAPAAIRR